MPRKTHGASDNPEYKSWIAMKSRCLNPHDSSYYLYGERGITICEQWTDFSQFLEDMGEKPEPKEQYSIDRIYPNGNYEPSNCRWATSKEQGGNRRPKPKNPNKLGFVRKSVTLTPEMWNQLEEEAKCIII